MGLEVVVSGATGRMGQALARLMDAAEDLTAIGGIAPHAAGTDAATLGYRTLVDLHHAHDLLREADVIIDFSAPDHLRALLDAHSTAMAGRALIVGTTGLDDHVQERLAGLAAQGPVLVAPNFSIGVNVLLGLVERAARALPADRYDVEIVETHHGKKEDAPSGTALALGRAVADGRGESLEARRRDGRSGRPGPRPAGEIGLHALRGGGVAGEHVVHFLGARERIRLSHDAASRDLFAEGALLAARWLAGRGPGRYTMADVLGLND